MAIPSYDGPKEGSSATSKLLPLNGHLNFSSLIMACLLSYYEFGSTTFTLKAAMDGIPMVVTIACGFMKCKLWATLYNLLSNPPQLLLVHIPSPLMYFHIEILEFWLIFALLPSMPLAFDSNQVTSFHEGRIHLAFPLLIF
jgi:hypothetical protein